MGEELNELQRKMLSRRQQHYTQCATFNGLTLVAATIVVGFVFAFLWEQTSPPEFGTGAEYATSYIRSD